MSAQRREAEAAPRNASTVQEEPREARETMLQERYGLLLVSLVVLFLVQGIAPGGPWQEVLITALSASTLVLALRAGEARPRIARLAVVVGAMLVAAVAALALTGTDEHRRRAARERPAGRRRAPGDRVGVIRGLRARGETTVQAVLGVLSFYLMIGMFCAFAYGTIDNLGGAPSSPTT